MPGWVDGYRTAEASAAAVPLWVSVRALWSRIRHRKNPESVEGYKVHGLK